MSISPELFGLLGFGAAFVSFAVVLILVLASHPGTRQAYFLIAALVASLIWSGSTAHAIWLTGVPVVWTPVTDGLHVSVWLAFVAVLLLGGAENPGARRIGVGILSLGAVGFLTVVLTTTAPSAASLGDNAGLALIALLALPLLGLLALEQVLRNAAFAERRVLRPLAIGIGLIFMLEVFCYSQVFVFSDFNPLAWQFRGIGNAIAAPFVVVAIKRQQDWERELFLSRQVVFHTASLLAAGAYLVALGLAGSLIGPYDGTGRAILEIVILLAAGAVFLYALFSITLRRRFKAFIAKHFYRNRYDYRQEWLRLIATLAGGDDEASVSERGVKALAEIIEAPRGELWWADEVGLPLQSCGAWEMAAPQHELPADAPLVSFLAARHWVIDSEEYRQNPDIYEHAFEADRSVLDAPSIYVPLILDGDLRGVVRLDRRPDLGRLGFEDHDLLKTAGKQVAVFLAQERVQARLAETRQFEAFSRLTTFLMHDLKNMISQQELVVGNAKRFKHKPEFVDDAIRTIESSVRRTRKLLERLQSHDQDESASTIDLGKLLAEVVNGCSDRRPMPELRELPQDIYVAMNRERLTMALTHVIRNAQDATPVDGSIELRVATDANAARVEVADSGAGMTSEFIRDRLFRPFDSTKGAQGMGIGAYQVRETLRAAGGEVEVESVPGRGTTVRLRLPLVNAMPTSRTADLPAA